MNAFTYHGPLPADSPLFYGRATELAQLHRICRDVKSYAIVYGGRQSGKSSLLIRFSSQLNAASPACFVDFQAAPRATKEEAFAYIADQVLQKLGRGDQDRLAAASITNVSQLQDVLSECLRPRDIERLVLILEEWGALPAETCNALANALRSILSKSRAEAQSPLKKLVVVVAGSAELFDIWFAQNSPFRNVCEYVSLSDLNEGDATSLIVDHLDSSNTTAEMRRSIGKAIFDQVNGQPQLTQWLGSLIEDQLAQGQPYVEKLVEQSLMALTTRNRLYVGLRRHIQEAKLQEACRALLQHQISNTRLEEDLLKLELMGIAKQDANQWSVRNRFLAHMLAIWTDEQSANTPSPQTANSLLLPNIVKVFVGSTKSDLKPEREAVARALRRMGNIMPIMMEDFNSARTLPLVECLKKVDESQIYIGIFAHRYSTGITESEYRRAIENGWPCLIYLKDESVPVVPEHLDINPDQRHKLLSFKQELRNNHVTVDFFSADHLAMLVATDLYKLLHTGSPPTK